MREIGARKVDLETVENLSEEVIVQGRKSYTS